MTTNWGYGIHKDRQTDLDRNDRSLYHEMVSAEPTLIICVSCGTCSSACSAAQHVPFSLRSIIIRLQRGETHGMLKDLNHCMLCGKCRLACPRGVNTRNLIINLQQALQNHAGK